MSRFNPARLTAKEFNIYAENVKQLKFPYGAYDGAIVTITNDDGNLAFYSNLKPILDAKGIKCNLAIYTSVVGDGNHFTWDQLRQLQSEGYEISNHTNTHPDIDIKSLSEIESEILISQNLFKTNGINVDTIVYPAGFDSNDAAKKDLFKKYFKAGFAAQNLYNDVPIESIYLHRHDWGGITTLAGWQSKIDVAVSNKSWMVFMMHDWMDSVIDGQQLLSDVIDYIQLQGIPIVTISQGLVMVGNVIEIGNKSNDMYYIMSKIGKTIASNSVDNFKYIGAQSLVGNPITFYNEDCITVSRHGSATTDKPDNNTLSGLCFTHRALNDATNAYGIQLYIPINYLQNKILKRSWDSSGSVWRTWEEIDKKLNTVIINSDDFIADLDVPITSYPANQVTIQKCSNSSAGVKPSANSAIVTTHRIATSTGNNEYSYQEWKAITATAVWRRNWDHNTASWGAFEQH